MKANYEFLKDCEIVEGLDNHLYILEKKSKKYLVKRMGKCDLKCKGECCKFMHFFNVNQKYSEGFGTKSKKTGNHVVIHKCKFLRYNKCTLWSKRNFPSVCKQFPHPNDAVYHEVMDKCGFWFKIMGELKNVKD